MAKKLIFIIHLFLSICYPRTGYPGFHAWTSPSRMALGGSGYLSYSPLSAYSNPSTISKIRIFSTGLIRYPAGITSQSLATNFPRKQGVVGFAVRHLAYGSFDGYDNEANPTSAYHSSDTWIKAKYSTNNKKSLFQYGSAFTLFSSNLNGNKTRAVLVSAGVQLDIEKIKTVVGIGIENYSLATNKNLKMTGIFPRQMTISISKDLAYLPMKIFLDREIVSVSKKRNIYLGGQANITHAVQILWGTSTKKIDHNIRQDLWKTVLGASGFGIVYMTGVTKIIYCSYIFGTGTIIHGIEMEIAF